VVAEAGAAAAGGGGRALITTARARLVSSPVSRLIPILLAASGLAASVPAEAAEPNAPPAITAPPPTPLLQEYRYKMSAAIRPLLFWVGDDDVGGARITWRRGNEGRGFELLLGADPARAPRRINRWGWVREDQDAQGASMIGLIRKTDEKTLDESKANLSAEGSGGYVFKAIQAREEHGAVTASNTVWRVERDYTYRDLEEVRRIVAAPAPARLSQTRLPPGARPSFMIAVADAVDEAIAVAVGANGQPPRLLAERSWVFLFDANPYDLRLREARWEKPGTYAGRFVPRLVRLEFESYNRKLQTTERFTLVCGADGPWKGVPVYVKYQPKWWFKAEGVLDETQTFQ
jgi:hypothetical protein